MSRQLEMVHRLNRIIGANIRHWRKERGVSQKQLAELLGCSFQQVQKYECGANRISAVTLALVAEMLGVPLLVLMDSSSPWAEDLAA